MHWSVVPVNKTYVVQRINNVCQAGDMITHTSFYHLLEYLKLTNFIVMVCRKKVVSINAAILIGLKSYQVCEMSFLGSNQPLCKTAQIHSVASSFHVLRSSWLLRV